MVELSVIIPTRNRAHLLDRTLEALFHQTYSQERFEVIVVDNGSTDSTAQVAEKYKSRFKNFNYLFEISPGLHVGRHAGMKTAKGQILVYGDDDIRPFPTWLEGVRESFQDPQVALVGGNNLPEYENDPPKWVDLLWSVTPWGKALGYYSVLDFGNEIAEISPYYVWGCNFSIRKSILREIGGFHPDGMPEELLHYRGDGETAVSKAILNKGYKTIFNPKASVYHCVSSSRVTLNYLYKRAYAQGISDSYTQIRAMGGQRLRLKMWNSLRRLKAMLRNVLRKDNEPQKRILKGYWDGFMYHQRKVSNDVDLLRWVLKEQYMD